MPAILKPANLSLTWASGGDVLNPGDTKYASGWAVEIPARQWFNYLDNRQDTALAHINQHGIAVWDADTEYQYEALGEKSLAMGSDGIIYRTLTTNTNQDPTTTVGVHWEIAFADSGAFYTKTESDDNYLAKTQNLADLPNTATARTNLSVYSQAQTYTKTEVDAKTTVASTAQTQAQVSNTVLLSALKLAEAFSGSNRSLAVNGYQKIPGPGGLIVQWGTSPIITAGSSSSITLPTNYTTNHYNVFLTAGVAANSTTPICAAGSLLTLTDFTIRNRSTVDSAFYWISLGK
jgi:hypothetical protein